MSFGKSFAKAYATSAANTAKTEEAKAKQITSRAEAKVKRDQLVLDMAKAGYSMGAGGQLERSQVGRAQDEVLLQELEFQKQQNAATRNKLALVDSDQAIMDFTQSGDATDLQNMLNNNDTLRQLWSSRGVQQVSAIDWEHDRALLKEAGLPLFWADSPEDREEAGMDNYWFKISDGQKWSIGSVASMTRDTGALKRLSSTKSSILQERLDSTKKKMNQGAFEQKVNFIYKNTPENVRGGLNPQETRYNIIQGLLKSKDPVSTAYAQNAALRAEAEGVSTDEIIRRDEARKTPEPAVSPKVRDKEQLIEYAQSNLGLEGQAAVDYAEQQTSPREYVPSDVKELDAAEQARTKMVEDFGGEDQFFATDFNEPKNFRKAIGNVERMEKLAGVELSSADKKSMQDINSLLSLGEPSAKLTSRETGIVDNFLKGIREYMTDNVEGTEATASYNTFRNSVRHALYGAALTPAEITSFNQAFGTLGQQLGPVITKLRTSVGQVKAKLDTIARLGNPYTAKVRLGVSQERVDEIIGALDQRLDLIENASKPISEQVKPSVDLGSDTTPFDQLQWIK